MKMMIDEIIEKIVYKCDALPGNSERRKGLHEALSVIHEVFRKNEVSKVEFRDISQLPSFDRLDRLIVNLDGLKIYQGPGRMITYELDGKVFQSSMEIATYVFAAYGSLRLEAQREAKIHAMKILSQGVKEYEFERESAPIRVLPRNKWG